MKDIQAGKFTIRITEPYPVWVKIYYADQEIHGIRHDELSDLEYAVKKAMNVARAFLKEQKDEV